MEGLLFSFFFFLTKKKGGWRKGEMNIRQYAQQKTAEQTFKSTISLFFASSSFRPGSSSFDSAPDSLLGADAGSVVAAFTSAVVVVE